jgi:hypothetical protein
MNMFDAKAWIRDATERVLSTAGEVAAAVAALYVFVDQTGLLDLDWATLATAGPAVIALTVFKTVAASRFGDKGTSAIDTDPEKRVELDEHTHDEV